MMRILAFILFMLISYLSYSQSITDSGIRILDLNASARIGGNADIGAVSSPFYKDAGLFQNPALVSLNSNFSGTGVFYRNSKDQYLYDIYVSGWEGYHSIDSSNALGFNFSYLNYNDSIMNNSNLEYEPYELYLQLIYSRSLNKLFRTGLGIKYVRSNYGFGQPENKINTYSLDIGIVYSKKYLLSDFSNLNTNGGLAITNFGPRLSNNEQKAFLPTKLLIGLFINPDIYVNELFRLNIELAYQAEKYLIPSTPEYNDVGEITNGMNPDIDIFTALYQSFYDSPDGFLGELNEIRNKFGSEFRLNYKNLAYISLRHGRIFELESSGGGNYQTFGGGLGILGFIIDGYFIQSDNETIDNNWAISLGARYNLDGKFFRF